MIWVSAWPTRLQLARARVALARWAHVWQQSVADFPARRIAMTTSSKVILASGSPRRRQLLSEAGVEFEVVESGVAEVRRDGEDAREYALRMAREKARTVSARMRDAIAIGADTIVICGDEVLEKPLSSDDARRMLRMLSGRTHVVVTAFAIARDDAIVESEAVASRVTFRTLTDGEIDEYVATGESLDKAGAYGIQGLGGGFIASVDGPRDNVMGLPTARVVAALARAGVEPRR